MAFGGMFNAFAKKTAEDLAEQYGGATGKSLVGGAFSGDNELVGKLMGALSGKQQLSLENVLSMVQGGGGSALLQHAEDKGLDNNLLEGVGGMLSGGGGGDKEDGGGGGGFDMGAIAGMVASLTSRGGGGGGEGFMQLLQGAGGGGKDGASTGNIVKILLGLAKSYFNVKGKSSPAIQGWDAAGAKNNEDDKNFLNWAMSVIRDLVFPGKKPKEIIEQGGDDNISEDLDGGGSKKDDGSVKGWIDGHPEIGKMQKDVFDDIFDTTDDDVAEEDDPNPIIPTPQDFVENSTCLDHASILFINTNLLLEYRKKWRFLYSSQTHDRDLATMMEKITYRGPTILVIKDTEGNMFGAHASTSWCKTDGGWVGNGECFLFSIKPKMAVFHSTGKDENFQLLSSDNLAMGGKTGFFGLELESNLSRGASRGGVDTFHTIQLTQDEQFTIDQVEVWGLGPEPDMSEEKENVKPRQPNLETRGGDVDMGDLMDQIM